MQLYNSRKKNKFCCWISYTIVRLAFSGIGRLSAGHASRNAKTSSCRRIRAEEKVTRHCRSSNRSHMLMYRIGRRRVGRRMRLRRVVNGIVRARAECALWPRRRWPLSDHVHAIGGRCAIGNRRAVRAWR